MKLNNKGFAISSIMYIILIMAVILISVTLAILSSRKLILDKIRKETTDNIYGISYNSVINTLKHEAISYASNNNVEKENIKIGDFETSVSQELLEHHELTDKYLTLFKNNNNYDVYLGQPKKITDISKPIENMLGIVDYKIEGNSYQQTYTGKNLFDISKVKSSSCVVNNGDGTLSVTPTADSSGVNAASPGTLKDYAPSLEVGKTYYLNATTTANTEYIFFNVSNRVWVFGTTLTITEDDLNSTVYWYANGTDTSFTAVISNIQIESGTVATSYEPYVGGIPSPNPNYPQEIQSVGDKTTNIFDGKLVYSDKIATGSSGGSNRVESVNFIPVKPNTTYRFSRNNERVYQYDENYTQIKRTDTGNYGNTITTLSNCKYIRCVWFGTDDATQTIWINEGTNKLDYEPYNKYKIPIILEGKNTFEGSSTTEQSYMEPVTTNIYLDEPLRKVGNGVDYIHFGEQTVSINTTKKIFDGSEDWSLPTSKMENHSSHRIINFFQKYPVDKFFSNYFETASQSIYYDYKKSIATSYTTTDQLIINIDKSIVDSQEQTTSSTWIDWLQTKFNEGNPLVIEYQLNEDPSNTKKISLPKINSSSALNYISIDTQIQPSNVEFTIIEKIRKL